MKYSDLNGGFPLINFAQRMFNINRFASVTCCVPVARTEKSVYRVEAPTQFVDKNRLRALESLLSTSNFIVKQPLDGKIELKCSSD